MNKPSIIGTEVTNLFTNEKVRALLAIAFGWALLVGSRAIYPVLIPYFREEYSLTLTYAGILITVLWLGTALGQFPGGILADRYTERDVMVAGMFFAIIGIVLVVVSKNVLILFVATGVLGVGNSLYPVARITSVSKIYPNRVGRALGVVMASGDLGQTFLPATAGLITLVLSWKAGLGFVVPFMVISGFYIIKYVPITHINDNTEKVALLKQIEYLREQLFKLDLLAVSAILTLFFIIWQSFTGFYPTYLIEIKGLSTREVSFIYALFFAVGAVVKPIAGVAYDNIGLRKSLFGIYFPAIIGLMALPFTKEFWTLVAITAFIGVMLGSGAVVQSFLSESFPVEIRGIGLGIVRSVTAIIGSLGPVLFGIIADTGFFNESYMILSLLLTIALLMTLFVKINA